MLSGRAINRDVALQRERARRRLAGLVFIGLAAVLLLIAVLRPNPFAEHKSVWVVFDSAQGLGRIDRDVRVGGVNVGEVGEIEREGDDVRVELVLDPEIEVHTDAFAELRPHTLFEGTDFVDLHPGSPRAPLLGDGEAIEDTKTRVYISIDTALRVLRKPVREGFQDLADVGAETLRGGAITGLQQTLRAAPELLRDLGPTARALQGPEGDELAAAIRGLSATVDRVAEREADLIPLARNARRTFAALNVDGDVPLDAALAELPASLAELERSAPRLRLVVERLGEISEDIEPALEELAPTLHDLRPILTASIPVVRRALPLVTGLRTLLLRSSNAAPELKVLLRLLRESGVLLDESILPAFHRDSQIGIPAYLQLVSAFTAGAGAERPFQTPAQNPDGAGHAIRLGFYADDELATSSFLPACDTIAAVNPELAAQLEAAGLCQP